METSLYAPVKQFLENLGFHVKGEIGGCDLVGIAEGSPPVVVIGELKLTFNLDLVLQGIDRADICDEVWLAVRASRRSGRERDARVRKLCRRLGFGPIRGWHRRHYRQSRRSDAAPQSSPPLARRRGASAKAG